jgi:hypothetical protein
VEIPLRLRDFQAQWESPALGLFHGAACSTALLPINCRAHPLFHPHQPTGSFHGEAKTALDGEVVCRYLALSYPPCLSEQQGNTLASPVLACLSKKARLGVQNCSSQSMRENYSVGTVGICYSLRIALKRPLLTFNAPLPV